MTSETVKKPSAGEGASTLAFVTLLVSTVTFIYLAKTTYGWEPAIKITSALAVCYPICGALFTGPLLFLRRLVYGDDAAPLSRGERLNYAAVWPLYVVYAIIVYPCVALLGRGDDSAPDGPSA